MNEVGVAGTKLKFEPIKAKLIGCAGASGCLGRGIANQQFLSHANHVGIGHVVVSDDSRHRRSMGSSDGAESIASLDNMDPTLQPR